MKYAMSLLGLVLLTACGGGPAGPSGTPVPSPTPKTGDVVYNVSDITTDAPVTATVQVAGKDPIVSSIAAFSGVTKGVDASASADKYLDRLGTVTGFGQRDVRLIPDTLGTYVLELWNTDFGNQGTQIPMLKLANPNLCLILDPSIRTSENVAVAEEVAAKLSTDSGWIHATVADTAPEGSVTFTVTIDSSVYPNAGRTDRTIVGFSIIGGIIRIQRKEFLKLLPLMLHETGHSVGLEHLHTVDGLMGTTSKIYNYDDFTPGEAAVLRAMQFRDAGNEWPDNGRSVPSALSMRYVDSIP